MEIDELSQHIQNYCEQRGFNSQGSIFIAETIEELFTWREGSSLDCNFTEKNKLQEALLDYLKMRLKK